MKKQHEIIFGKFVDLSEKDFVDKLDLSTLINYIDELCKKKILTERDFYFNKIETIKKYLQTNLNQVYEMRSGRKKFTVKNDFLLLIKSDLGNFEYKNLDIEQEIESIDLTIEDDESYISPDYVVKILSNIVLARRKIYNESALEWAICERLRQVYGNEKVYRQYNIGGFLGLKSDIDIYNGQIGLELKMADFLSASDMQRLIGQVIYYKNRVYNNNLLLFLASSYDISPKINELKEFVEELNVRTVYVKLLVM